MAVLGKPVVALYSECVCVWVCVEGTNEKYCQHCVMSLCPFLALNSRMVMWIKAYR